MRLQDIPVGILFEGLEDLEEGHISNAADHYIYQQGGNNRRVLRQRIAKDISTMKKEQPYKYRDLSRNLYGTKGYGKKVPSSMKRATDKGIAMTNQLVKKHMPYEPRRSRMYDDI